MTAPVLEGHPEEMPDVPMLSQAMQDIVVRHYVQHLRLGKKLDLDDGTSPELYSDQAGFFNTFCKGLEAEGNLTYTALIQGALFNTLRQNDVQAIRIGLLNVGAILVSWLEDIDRREVAA